MSLVASRQVVSCEQSWTVSPGSWPYQSLWPLRVIVVVVILNPLLDRVQKRRVVPDVPSREYETNFDSLLGLVRGVSDKWCCHMPEKDTIALFLPSNQESSLLSREQFVRLLEYCEDELNCKRVLACFDKNAIDSRHGIPRAFNCIGFNVLAPEHFPAGIDSSNVFAMVYNI
ncbi:hypothetical protein QR680_008227 [Steinernema hermaphroditum]|uniref:Ornithine decarboxylase antizyme n=1 Tax=Steinernema hermaphroditum TaxID=289476 RepID=A0AA39IHD7_9BILA|nr:hypothetical protein QR680_008227 [Steinernema hermaphroditum]